MDLPSRADILVPDLPMGSNVARQHLDAFARIHIDHRDPILAEPFDAALKGLRFTDDDGADTELPYQAAAVPARREGGNHYAVAVTSLTARPAKCVGLAVDRGVVFLNTPVMTAAQQLSAAVEERRPDRYAPFCEARPCLVNGDIEHVLIRSIWFHEIRFYKDFCCCANLVNMSQQFQPGDFLIFQLEAGFALLRLLAIDEENGAKTWHVASYEDFFPDVDRAEDAAQNPKGLRRGAGHLVLTNRAFESTQVARIANLPLDEEELEPLLEWRNDPTRIVSDRSVRLLLGLR